MPMNQGPHAIQQVAVRQGALMLGALEAGLHSLTEISGLFDPSGRLR